MAVKGLDELGEDSFPREARTRKSENRNSAHETQWPSREPKREITKEPEGALSIKGPGRIIDRFKSKTNNGRDIKYYAMLEAMMNFCDRNGFNAKLELMTEEERAETLRAMKTYL